MVFDGNRNCGICSKELKDNERKFGVSLTGYTYVFCRRCLHERKEAIKELLHGDE